MEVAQARRVERPRWLNLRLILGLLLFSLAFLGGQRLLAQADTGVLVWSARGDLAVDQILTSEDLVPVQARLDPQVLDGYVMADEAVSGVVVTRPLLEGELVPRSAIAAAEVGEGRSITIPVAPEHAVGGMVRPGDRIDVITTFDAGDVRARTITLIHAVRVLDVVEAEGLVLGEGQMAGITVEVPPGDAARLAFAIRTGEIDIARLSGAAGAAKGGWVTSQDL